jgi:hypothetical protein
MCRYYDVLQLFDSCDVLRLLDFIRSSQLIADIYLRFRIRKKKF